MDCPHRLPHVFARGSACIRPRSHIRSPRISAATRPAICLLSVKGIRCTRTFQAAMAILRDYREPTVLNTTNLVEVYSVVEDVSL